MAEKNDTAAMQEVTGMAYSFNGIPIVTGNMNENVTRIELLTNFTMHFSTTTFLHVYVKRNIHSGNGNILYVSNLAIISCMCETAVYIYILSCL